MEASTSVLIVGGSVNGLTMAMLLARRRVPCLVVERHPRTSIQYKFRGISPRSMEIYRSAGIEPEIRAHDLIDDRSAYVGRMKNLAGGEVWWHGIPWADTTDISPTEAATCDQDQLEPILRAHAERHGADVRFNTELVSVTQARDEVIARIRDRSTGAESGVRAQYIIGADGTQSAVREAVGIRRHGPGVLQHWMNVIFAADLPTVIDGRAIRSAFVTDINGTLVPRGDGRWLMAVQFVPDRGERAEDFTPDQCRDLIRRGTGRADLRVDIVDARPWEAAAAVADRYTEGRVLIAGSSSQDRTGTAGPAACVAVSRLVRLASCGTAFSRLAISETWRIAFRRHKLRVNAFSVSADGFGAGPDQGRGLPLGRGGEQLHEWFLPTRTFQREVHRRNGGTTGVDDDFAARSFENLGAWIMGRNMFGPVRGPWPDDEWKGWWGANPPYHVPVFVLTHHPRAPLEMEGGTVFHFVTEGIEAALDQARVAARGKDVRIGGGAATIRQYLQAGLLDEMHLAISPILLGQGEPLFEGIDLPALGYRVKEHVSTGAAMHLVVGR